jgi:hypothetical protein
MKKKQELNDKQTEIYKMVYNAMWHVIDKTFQQTRSCEVLVSLNPENRLVNSFSNPNCILGKRKINLI